MLEVSELQVIKKELISLKEAATKDRVKNLLQIEINKVDNELVENSIKQTNKSEATKLSSRVIIDIKEFAFDESPKFAKIYIPFDTKDLKDSDIEFKLSEDNSFSLIIRTSHKSFQLIAHSLLMKINIEKSFKKIKPDMVAIYLKKAKESEMWGCLTATEKRLKEIKTTMLENNYDDGNSDPGAQLMNLMKKVYESGNSEVKRTIAKAWIEGQNKQKEFPM